jgi:hypothetical protein
MPKKEFLFKLQTNRYFWWLGYVQNKYPRRRCIQILRIKAETTGYKSYFEAVVFTKETTEQAKLPCTAAQFIYIVVDAAWNSKNKGYGISGL